MASVYSIRDDGMRTRKQSHTLSKIALLESERISQSTASLTATKASPSCPMFLHQEHTEHPAQLILDDQTLLTDNRQTELGHLGTDRRSPVVLLRSNRTLPRQHHIITIERFQAGDIAHIPMAHHGCIIFPIFVVGRNPIQCQSK